MDLFLQRLVDGIENGAIYASLALALVIVYRTNGLLNFAQGEMAMLSIFVTWQFTDWGFPIVLAVVAAMGVSFVFGALIERFLIRTVGDVETAALPLVIVTIGLFLGLNSLAPYIWGTDGKTLPSLFSTRTWDVAGVTLSATKVGIVVVLLIEVLVLYVVFQKTKLGLAMRGVASTKESASLVGIRVGTMLMFGWGLAAAVGAVAGVMRAETLVAFDANTMQIVLIYAFAAATLGGFDSLVGAVVGGLIVGVVEQLAAGYVGWIGNDLALGSAFVLILAVLLIRPQGLLGSKQVARV